MLVDKNGNKVAEGCYIRLIGCNVKNDNGCSSRLLLGMV